tara:strand:- start:972 stop:1706 length:735 start_codon:yes stop_codon:yes gene_type:complete
MNITVVMWYDEGIKEYADNCYKINKAYCDKHGYTLIKSSERTYTDRKPHWERFPLILKHINDTDYIMWVDADAHFYIDAPRLETIIEKYNTDIILSEDIDNAKYNINTGVFILKNTQQVIDIVDAWTNDDNLYQSLNYSTWQDQALVRYFYKNNLNSIRDISSISPYGELQHFKSNDKKENTFIHHYAGTKKIVRTSSSAKYVAKNIDNSSSSMSFMIFTAIGIFVLLLILLWFYKFKNFKKNK